MNTKYFRHKLEDGRELAIWRSSSEEIRNTEAAPVVVICPGFGRKMRQLGAVALTLVSNGCVVYRFDSLSHVGLSDGSIANSNISDLVCSLEATIALARSIDKQENVSIVGMSISSLAAYWVASNDQNIESIVMLSGVVDGVMTLEAATGEDYTNFRSEDLPKSVEIEGFDVNPRNLWNDHKLRGWLSSAKIAHDISRCGCLIVNFVGEGDPWVSLDDCQNIFEVSFLGDDTKKRRRIIVKLPFNGHDIAGNPLALEKVLKEMTSFILFGEGPLNVTRAKEIVVPSFRKILENRVSERSLESEIFLDLKDD